MELTGYQIKCLADFTDGEDIAEIIVEHFEASKDAETGEHMPAGLYAYFTEYPEEGRLYLPEAPEPVERVSLNQVREALSGSTAE